MIGVQRLVLLASDAVLRLVEVSIMAVDWLAG